MTQREPRQRNPGYLAFLRLQPCCVCGRPGPSEAAHIRMGSPKHGKRQTGLGEKPSDRWATSLCARHHRTGPDAQHAMGEADFWRMHGLDPFQIAAAMFAGAGSPDKPAQPKRAAKQKRGIEARSKHPCTRCGRSHVNGCPPFRIAVNKLIEKRKPIQPRNFSPPHSRAKKLTGRPFPKVSRPVRSARP